MLVALLALNAWQAYQLREADDELERGQREICLLSGILSQEHLAITQGLNLQALPRLEQLDQRIELVCRGL